MMDDNAKHKESSSMKRTVKVACCLCAAMMILSMGCRKDAGEPCEDAANCKEGLVCLDGNCFQMKADGGPCEKAEHCEDGLACVEGKCYRLGAEGKSCEREVHCLDGLVCLDGACFKLRAEGEAAAQDPQCRDGLVVWQEKCFKKRVAGGACQEAAECVDEHICLDGACFLPRKAGEACKKVEQCIPEHICLAGACFLPRKAGEACENVEQCAPEQICLDGACFHPRKAGEACEKPEQCAGGIYCLSGSCFVPKKLNEECSAEGECMDELSCFTQHCIPASEAGYRREEETRREDLVKYFGKRATPSAEEPMQQLIRERMPEIKQEILKHLEDGERYEQDFLAYAALLDAIPGLLEREEFEDLTLRVCRMSSRMDGTAVHLLEHTGDLLKKARKSSIGRMQRILLEVDRYQYLFDLYLPTSRLFVGNEMLLANGPEQVRRALFDECGKQHPEANEKRREHLRSLMTHVAKLERDETKKAAMAEALSALEAPPADPSSGE